MAPYHGNSAKAPGRGCGAYGAGTAWGERWDALAGRLGAVLGHQPIEFLDPEPLRRSLRKPLQTALGPQSLALGLERPQV